MKYFLLLEKIECNHDVRFKEVEEVCLSEQRHVRRARGGIYKVFGQTAAGRYILAVLVHKGGGEWKVATARPMTGTEKRLHKKVAGGA